MAGYTANDIEVLEGIAHVRINPGMYIGNTNNPVHLIEEVLDNALDECTGGFANIINVEIDTVNKLYSVSDNGRGIPFENNIPVIISTKLHSGAKFQDRKQAYEICSGLHGIGLVAVNVLSTDYIIEIFRDGKHACFNFTNSKLKNSDVMIWNKERPFSTKISFKPDPQIFEVLEPDIERVKRRLLIASVELPNCKFILNVDGKIEEITISKENYFAKQCNGDDLSETFSFCSNQEKEKFEVLFCYSYNGAITPKIMSSVNLLPVTLGGTHVNMFYDIIRNYFVKMAKKSNIRILPPDCLCGLRCYFSLSLIKPELSGQTKDELINRRSYLEPLVKNIENEFEKYFNSNPDILNNILEHFKIYRARIESKHLKVKSTSRASTKFTKLRDCSVSGGELFIVEGESAAGSFISCRDPRKHAILPLKGKIPSAATKKDILKNEEIKELISALGTGYGEHFNLANIKYKKIICACDADPDGKHIASLVTMAIAILVPEIIQNGFFYIAETPLYAINDKDFIPLWSPEELENAQNEGRKITRFKGLGELNPDQLYKVAIDDSARRLIPISFTSDLNSMIKLFTDPIIKRQLLES